MPVMIETVNGIAQANPDKKIILMGCGDNYVALAAQAPGCRPACLQRHRALCAVQHARAVPEEGDLLRAVREAGVPYPHTFTFTMAMLNAQGEASAEVLDQIDFPFPMILEAL